METNITSVPAFQSSGDLDAYMRSFQAEETKVAAVSTSRQMDISLVTQEGDKVTISLDAKTAALYGTYESLEMDKEGATYQKSELTAALYEREMTFTVEGDLNREERRDIRKALKALDRMMHNFSEGRMKPMLRGARRLQGLDSIAGLDAQFSYERQVLVAEQTQIAAEYTGTAGADLPATAQAPQVPEAHPSSVMQLMEEAGTVAGEMAQTVADAQTPMERMLSFVDQLLEDYREQMASFDPLGADMVDHIADRLHDALARFNGAFEKGLPAAE